MNLRLLLVESQPENALFLQDVLTESEDGRHWGVWMRTEMVHALSWPDATAVLANETFDVILLSLDLADSRGSETFRQAQAVAQQVPVVLLVPEEDVPLATRLIRDGAQDFLVKSDVDCRPLVHAIRNAIERHRLLSAARAAAFNDFLTGLPNRNSFLTYASRDRKLAERLGVRLMVMIAEPRNLSEMATNFGEQRRDLAMVEAADHLRSLIGPTDLVARIGDVRFGLTIFDTECESVEAAWARIHAATSEHRIQIGAAIFDDSNSASLDVLLEQAARDLTPAAAAMRR